MARVSVSKTTQKGAAPKKEVEVTGGGRGRVRQAIRRQLFKKLTSK